MGRNPTAEDARHMLRKAGVPLADIDRQLGGAQPYTDKLGLKEPTGKNTRANSYGAKRTKSHIIGRTFHSGFECWCAEALWAMNEAGEISELKFQPRVSILGKFGMIPDFRYVLDGRVVHHEAKGRADKRWETQVKLWELFGPTDYFTSYQTKHPPDLRHPSIIMPRTNIAVQRMALRDLARDFGGQITITQALALMETDE